MYIRELALKKPRALSSPRSFAATEKSVFSRAWPYFFIRNPSRLFLRHTPSTRARLISTGFCRKPGVFPAHRVIPATLWRCLSSLTGKYEFSLGGHGVPPRLYFCLVNYDYAPVPRRDSARKPTKARLEIWETKDVRERNAAQTSFGSCEYCEYCGFIQAKHRLKQSIR